MALQRYVHEIRRAALADHLGMEEALKTLIAALPSRDCPRGLSS